MPSGDSAVREPHGDAYAVSIRMEILRIVLASDLSCHDLVESVDRLATWVLTGETGGRKPEEPA